MARSAGLAAAPLGASRRMVLVERPRALHESSGDESIGRWYGSNLSRGDDADTIVQWNDTGDCVVIRPQSGGSMDVRTASSTTLERRVCELERLARDQTRELA